MQIIEIQLFAMEWNLEMPERISKNIFLKDQLGLHIMEILVCLFL